ALSSMLPFPLHPARASPATFLRYSSGHHDDVTAFQQYVLLQIAAAHDVVEPEPQCNLPAIFPSQDENVVRGRESRRAAGYAERLHDVDSRVHDELAGVVHLA